MPKSVAIIGAGVVTAMGAGIDANWKALLGGRTGIKLLTRFPGNKYISDVGAEVNEDTLDILRDDIDLGELSRAYSMALWVGKQALAGRDSDLNRTALILSTTKADFEYFEQVLNNSDTACARRFNPGVMASDLARYLQIAGPSFAVSNACASGIVALIQGSRMLNRHQVNQVLVVGVDVLTDFIFGGFSSLQALSSKPSRPFDEARDGLSLGEGAAAMLLSTADAISSDSALAYLRGWSVTNDGEHITAPSREGLGLQRAIKGALDMSELTPDAIGYINAHGTGTLFNDEMESHAVASVFDSSSLPWLTSMKGSIGHTLGAAGVIETVLSLPVLSEKRVPPSVGFEKLGVPHNMNIPTKAQTCPDLRNILCMKSGFGGVNAALVLGRGESA